MKIKISFIPLIFAITIVFLIYMLYTGSSKKKDNLSTSKQAFDRSKELLAKQDLKLIKRAIESYEFEKAKLPKTIDDLVPEFLRNIPLDPWGKKYFIKIEDSKIKIISSGKDRIIGTTDDIYEYYN